MARQAGAVQTRPMTLSALTRQIQAIAESQGWVAKLMREGDALVVELTGPICPDPLLAMVAVQTELECFDATGLEAVKLCGHATETSPGATAQTGGQSIAKQSESLSVGWVSVIDLDQYFAQRAKLTPEAFGLSTAEASHMACAAERNRLDAPAAQPHSEPKAASPLAPRTGYDHYRGFIAQHSSWFSQTVRDNPRLYKLAKQRQHYTIGTLSHYLVDTLAQDEQLVDLMPAQKRNRGCGLIFTDQRAIALSQQGRGARNRNRNHHGLQVWIVPWDWVHKVEICQDAICFHYGRSKEYFHVDLDALYHLRGAIPREIPVRMVHKSAPTQQPMLKTKAGLAMIAGVMFALGSGFSLVNTLTQQQRINARSSSLSASSDALPTTPNSAKSQTGSGRGSLVSNQSSTEGAIATSLAQPTLTVTATPVQCVNSFNAMAQPNAYATFNQVTRTLQVNLQKQGLSQMSPQQFNPMAAIVAEEVLTSCQSPMINQVTVTDGTLRYQQQR